ncbi:hypothetical protein [Sulfurisphaera tokodaii]|uniref:Uncharacterized protein n=2 Tax=Sulfurisphaera tokodaii TaxID=111955 RepID=Q972Q0_SULTO|nr:hypothetical protein [Sulfurisphaera tokodaii]BAB66114.1 hypothetical protein STK_10830 [Sulfurisphaera tokodaii str. 7]HII74484.1 hypothetical protein [Sulfurisphaera tokodaii]
MQKIDNCCNSKKRISALDFLMNQKYTGRNIEGYNTDLIKTPKGIVKLYWKKEGGKIDIRYSSPTCFTTRIALEAICEWICNGEVKNYREAIEKLYEIKGYKVTEDVKNLVYEVFMRIRE